MTAVKSNQVVMREYRNTADKLWDIPVHKTLLKYDNVVLPPVHETLYNNTSHPSLRSSPHCSPCCPKQKTAMARDNKAYHVDTITDEQFNKCIQQHTVL